MSDLPEPRDTDARILLGQAPQCMLHRSDWKIVYKVQGSEEQRDGLSVHVDVAANLYAAMQVADKRAGRFAKTAKRWSKVAGEYHPWTREVPGLGWQHIQPAPLFGTLR